MSDAGVVSSNGRGPDGRFVKGGPGGPGRKPGIKVEFREAARARAAEMGLDLAREVGNMALIMIRQAQNGDVAAARFVTERLCGPVDDGSGVVVDARQINLGAAAPVPTGVDLGEYMRRVTVLSDQLIGGAIEPGEQIAPAEEIPGIDAESQLLIDELLQ